MYYLLEIIHGLTVRNSVYLCASEQIALAFYKHATSTLLQSEKPAYKITPLALIERMP